MQTITYGACADQAGDLHLPQMRGDDPRRAAVVCLLHGGFWRMPHGRDQMNAVAGDLATRGFAVWNLGYRRVGAPGGGWPGTFDDVVAGIDHLATLAADGVAIDPERVIVVGHSAGGQLALWCAHRDATDHDAHGPGRVRVAAAKSIWPAPSSATKRTWSPAAYAALAASPRCL